MVKIYSLSDPRNGNVRYVGKTTQTLRKRWYQHCSPYKLARIKSHKNSWITGLLNQKLKPVIELLDEVPDRDWPFWESYWIDQLASWGFDLVNMTEGGQGGNGGSNAGYRHTEEAKRRISVANSGPRPLEWVINSAEANKKPILQLDLQANLIQRWPSSTDAAVSMGDVNRKKNITACCRGKKNTAYGYIWKYESTEVKDKEP